jgi:hypothetical protein
VRVRVKVRVPAPLPSVSPFLFTPRTMTTVFVSSFFQAATTASFNIFNGASSGSAPAPAPAPAPQAL